jgi:RNase H-fold protein (predicted Holliday junction resolvase)
MSFLWISFSSLNDINEPNHLQSNTAPIIVGSSASSVPISLTGGAQDSSRKIKKFNLTLHRRLESTFPDWEERMSYQKKQEKFYKSAISKKREFKQLRININLSFYTNICTTEELNAIDYFHGRGIFAKY